MIALKNHKMIHWQPTPIQLARLKGFLFLLCLLPLAGLLWTAESGQLGGEPEKFVEEWTGIWTFNFLLLTLAISPLRNLTQLHWLLRLRRMLGLFTFFYAVLHLWGFVGFEHSFATDEIARDILKRPFVTVGFAAFVLLIPLAATSNPWAIRRMGGRRWQELHRNIYLIGILAAIHYFWLSKAADLPWPIAYALALGLLLAWRIRQRQRTAIPAPTLQNAKPLRFFKHKPE